MPHSKSLRSKIFSVENFCTQDSELDIDILMKILKNEQ